MILRGRAQHRGATDIDLLDRLRERGVRLRHGLAKWIEVHGDEIDRRYAVLFHRGDVIGIISSCQQPAVNFWMQGLYSTIHHLREPSHVLNANYRDLFTPYSL